jgi:hypothetical protein
VDHGATFLRWLIVIASPGEPGTDFAGFRGADDGVAGEGFLPVVPGLNRVAIGVAGASESAVRAGLLPWGVGLGCEPQSGVIERACLVGFTSVQENVTKAVERVGLQNPSADLAGHG